MMQYKGLKRHRTIPKALKWKWNKNGFHNTKKHSSFYQALLENEYRIPKMARYRSEEVAQKTKKFLQNYIIKNNYRAGKK